MRSNYLTCFSSRLPLQPFDMAYSPESSEQEEGSVSVGGEDDLSESQSTTTVSSDQVPLEEILDEDEKVEKTFLVVSVFSLNNFLGKGTTED